MSGLGVKIMTIKSAHAEEPLSLSKRRLEAPAAVTLTPASNARIADLMAKAPADAIGVKLSTPRRGCSGLAYSVDYINQAVPFDEKIETPGGTLYIAGRVNDGLGRG
jgi:iron-sulfur cluster assembly protein